MLASALGSQYRRTRLSVESEHKWLGLLWSAGLFFECAVRQRLAIADKLFQEINHLVAANAIPIHAAVVLFEAKVDGFVAYGRWLFGACVDAAPNLYNLCYDKWSLQLLGAAPWRRASVAHAELGWHLTGFARAVRDVSLRLAKLLLSGRHDIYVQSFHSAKEAPASWNVLSRQLLQDWSLT